MRLLAWFARWRSLRGLVSSSSRTKVSGGFESCPVRPISILTSLVISHPSPPSGGCSGNRMA